MTEHPNPWDCVMARYALKQSGIVAWKFHLDGADQVVLDEDADAQMRENGRALVYGCEPAQGEPVALKRYDFYCSYDGGGPAEAEESPHGMYVLYEDVAPPAQGEPVAFINVSERKLEWNGPQEWNTSTVGTEPRIPLYAAAPVRGTT